MSPFMIPSNMFAMATPGQRQNTDVITRPKYRPYRCFSKKNRITVAAAKAAANAATTVHPVSVFTRV